jgi:hypothetical protein
MNIVFKRLSTFYESQLLTTQFGFRSGKGCNDGIYVCKQLQEIAVRSSRRLYTCFVDLSAAYDHINRNFLFQSIRNRIKPGDPTDCIDIIDQLYKSTKSFISGDDPADENFSTSSGVRQGGNESPNLFNFYIDYALRVYRHKCDQANIAHLDIPFLIPNECTNREQRQRFNSRGIFTDDEGGYADDIGIHAWSQNNLSEKMEILFLIFQQFGLKLNLEKTETLVWNWNELDGPYPESILNINDIKLKNVKHFKYLGVWNTYNDPHIGEKELSHRINSAKASFSLHRKMLCNKNIQKSIRVTFLNALVRSRLTYGCHAWRPTNSEISKLSSTYNRFLRSLIPNGFKRMPPVNVDSDEPNWHYRTTNEQLFNITKTMPLDKYFHMQQQNWIAHVTRRENNDIIKLLGFHNTKTTKKGRPIPSIMERVVKESKLDRSQFLRNCFNKK